MWDWAVGGVDHSLPGNGGPACRDFLSLEQRCTESVVAAAVAIIAMLVAWPRLCLPCPSPCPPPPCPCGKKFLLVLMTLVFGIEIGFKLATKQMIWIGNPCHLATAIQIFILAAPPSRLVTAAFRLHMHMLTGAPLALLFPVINTRFLPGETAVYFLQHILMLVIPMYLMTLGDPFIPEALCDFNWAMMSFGFLFLYHFLPLQLLAYLSQVNLNNMLCPAVSDPFSGQWYRLAAASHQIILIPLQGKLLVAIAGWLGLLPCSSSAKPMSCYANCSYSNSRAAGNKSENHSSEMPSLQDSRKEAEVEKMDMEIREMDDTVHQRVIPEGEPLQPQLGCVRRIVNGKLMDKEENIDDVSGVQSSSPLASNGHIKV